MGAHGLTGTGVGCVWSSPGGVCAPGSRKEKKLWERECLWWCPRLDAPPDVDGCIGCAAGAEDGGRPPNVKPSRKPSRKLRWPGPGDALGIGTPSSEGGGAPKSSSCAPSSAIDDTGSEPGRGKKTERLRECMRECLRGCEEGKLGEPSGGGVGWWSSGAV